jgi:hypothetical protein
MYQKTNKEYINELLPLARRNALLWLEEVEKLGYRVKITSSYRSNEEQDRLYKQGREGKDKNMNVVTWAKAGYSFHNHRVAFDFVPLTNGDPDYNDKEKFKKLGLLAIKYGFETLWEIGDYGHLQFTLGYKIEDFVTGRADLKKFELEEASKIPKIIQSSQDPHKLALTIKGLAGIIALISVNYGFDISEDVLTKTLTDIGIGISACITMVGLYRKK